MKSYLDTLRPFERRLVVGVGAVFFVVLNLWFVVPHFSDWGLAKIRMNKARQKLNTYQAKVRLIPTFQRQIAELESEGARVPVEDQALHFSSAVQAQAVQSGVNITQTGKILTRTNQFFLEQSQPLSLVAREQQLVDFLYDLGEGNSLIRVRDLALRTDATHQQLNANVKLVASYQKKQPGRGSATSQPATAQKAPAKAATPAPVPKTVPGPTKAAPPSSKSLSNAPGRMPMPPVQKNNPNPKKT